MQTFVFYGRTRLPQGMKRELDEAVCLTRWSIKNQRSLCGGGEPCRRCNRSEETFSNGTCNLTKCSLALRVMLN